MVVDLAFLLGKLESAPAGFGFSDVGQWLQGIPQIETLADVEAVFFERLTKKQCLALLTLIKQKYIKEGPAYNLFDDHFEQYTRQNNLEDFYRTLYLYGDASKALDFSPLKKQLTKLLVNDSSIVASIVLPTSKNLEALELSHLAKLTELAGIEKLKGLKYLAINKCPQLNDFSYIKKLKQLIWLDLSDNEQLVDLSFLLPSHKVVMLQLLNTTLLDNPKSSKRLANLKYLKYLTISGKQNQIATLRTLLPNCVINGITALNDKTPLLE